MDGSAGCLGGLGSGLALEPLTAAQSGMISLGSDVASAVNGRVYLDDFAVDGLDLVRPNDSAAV